MFFKYKVDYFNDITDTEDVTFGFVYGNDYSDAAAKVYHVYSDCIISMTLYEMSSIDDDVLDFDVDLCDKALFTVTIEESSPVKSKS